MTGTGSGGDATVRRGTVADAGFAARLHVDAIPEGFLPRLGVRFLARLYRRVCRHPGSFLLVADRDGRPAGFLAGTVDTHRLYRDFLLHDGVPAALVALPGLTVGWRRAWETLRYPTGTAVSLPPAELLAMAVRPEARGRGVGRALVGTMLGELSDRSVAAARVVTTSSNRSALELYRSLGFRPATGIELHPGTDSVILTWP